MLRKLFAAARVADLLGAGLGAGLGRGPSRHGLARPRRDHRGPAKGTSVGRSRAPSACTTKRSSSGATRSIVKSVRPATQMKPRARLPQPRRPRRPVLESQVPQSERKSGGEDDRQGLPESPTSTPTAAIRSSALERRPTISPRRSPTTRPRAPPTVAALPARHVAAGGRPRGGPHNISIPSSPPTARPLPTV